MPKTMPNAKRARKQNPAGHPRAQSHWTLCRSAGLEIVQLKPFQKFPWLIHGFSTRSGGVSELESPRPSRGPSEKVLNLGFTAWDTRERVETNRRRFQKSLGAENSSLLALRQIHSDAAHRVRASAGGNCAGDALLTDTPGLLLTIQTADCIPILMVDAPHRAVAAVHAGWRGTLARIAAKTAGRMALEFGSRPEEILAALGPGIGRCCYEVGPDVVKEFAALFPPARHWFDGPFESLSSGEDPNPLPWLTRMPPGHEPPLPRCHLDLRAANAAMLAEAGLRPANIFSSEFCTACRSDLFFSYRRERQTGRMMAAIGLQ